MLNSDYITKNLPNLCAQMRQRILKRGTWWNMTQTNMLIVAVDTLERDAFVPAPEEYTKKWGLVYSFSSLVDPFPSNVNHIVTNVVSLFEYCRTHPDEAPWERVFNAGDRKDGILRDCSLNLKSILSLIDSFRGRFNEGIFQTQRAMYPVLDNDKILSLMRPGHSKSLCMVPKQHEGLGVCKNVSKENKKGNDPL